MKILEKFGYPGSLIKSYQHWNLVLRPVQSTLGSLILISKSMEHQVSLLNAGAFNELKLITNDIESILSRRFNYSKINYQIMMMNDPEVHIHVFPRYESHCIFATSEFIDSEYPNPVNLATGIQLDPAAWAELHKTLRTDFNTTQDSTQQRKYKRIYTSGCFDIFHQGHLNIIRKSKELCDYLVVGVSTDELIIKSKGRPPLIPFEERISILEAIKYIDEVIPQTDKDKQRVVDQYNIDAISVGSDWKGKYPPVTCDMIYFDYTPNVSSTILKSKLGFDS